MNAHTWRKWSSIKIFMHTLIAICAFLVFWCQGACAMHLTPLDYPQQLDQSRHHTYPKVPKTAILPSSQHQFISQLRKHSPVTNKKLNISHYQQQQTSPTTSRDRTLQELWQTRMREKRTRMQAHRREKLLLQQLVDKHQNSHSNLIIDNLKHLINRNIITQHNHRNSTALDASQDQKADLYDTLHDIMVNISVASNRNRRDSRYHQQQQQPPQASHNGNSVNRYRQRRRRYCSARDPKTLAFEAPTVFEGKIKSMTTDRQANFSVTIEILKIYKQQANFTLPRQVRLQFAYKNTSECDIYREEFRHRGFVRDELEQGKIYFLFVKQISLGNFTILGQPIKKISRTAKDVEIGVSEKYGEYALLDYFALWVKLTESREEGRKKSRGEG